MLLYRKMGLASRGLRIFFCKVGKFPSSLYPAGQDGILEIQRKPENRRTERKLDRMNCYYIIGLRVDHRHSNALNLQKTLTEFGCNIKLRVGLHETGEDFCSDDGVIMLQACGDKETIGKMMDAFNNVEGVTAKLLDLN